MATAALPIDPGTDLSHYPDIDAGGSFVSGTQALAQALLRRLTTPSGGLFYDPLYGMDIRSFVNDSMTSDSVSTKQAQIEQEVLQDERVYLATAIVSFIPASSALTCTLQMQTSFGPFVMTLAVTAVTVTLLLAG